MLRSLNNDFGFFSLDKHFFDLANKFFETHEFSAELGPTFNKIDGGYELEIFFDGASLDDISIDVVDEKEVRISYFNKTENSTTIYDAKVDLPLDADASTLDAAFKDGVLKITVYKPTQTKQ